jgi:hypothetical protein
MGCCAADVHAACSADDREPRCVTASANDRRWRFSTGDDAYETEDTVDAQSSSSKHRSHSCDRKHGRCVSACA